jgi:hypothetical protein
MGLYFSTDTSISNYERILDGRVLKVLKELPLKPSPLDPKKKPLPTDQSTFDPVLFSNATPALDAITNGLSTLQIDKDSTNVVWQTSGPRGLVPVVVRDEQVTAIESFHMTDERGANTVNVSEEPR